MILLIFLSVLYSLLLGDVYAQEMGLIPMIKFKDADIKVVLQSIAEKAVKDGRKVNIVPSPSVEGLVSVNLESVDWQAALKSILSAHNYGYKWIGDNIILVATLEEIQERETSERARQEVETPTVKVFKLKYLDANDAKKAVTPMLSSVGKVSVLEATGQAGWEFGADVKKRARATEGSVSRTKILVVSDITKKLEEIEKLLSEIDIMPKQILIKAKIMEVDRDLLKDIGFDWGTGSGGASSSTLTQVDADDRGRRSVGAHALGGQNAPSLFGAETTGLDIDDTGLKVAFRKLTGAQFEVILHALEEDARTNILSSPSILTLNNQEASILVGTKYPIVKMQISEESSQIIGGSLEEYRDIGIQLNVVPQISGENEEFINMIVHPSITSYTSTAKVQATSGTGTSQVTTTLAEYPIIISREAETQIIVKDGETIVMGGLLKEVRSKQIIGIPLLKSIPFLGALFRREVDDTEQIDLLVFVTAKIVRPDEEIPQAIIDASRIPAELEKKIPSKFEKK